MKKFLPTILIFSFVLSYFFVLSYDRASAQSPASEISFFIEPSFHAQDADSVQATLKNISDRAYFYVENNYLQTLNNVQQIELTKTLVFLGDEFDKIIYPRLRVLYGSEWTPGIDNDARITILVANLKSDKAGFVDISNHVPATENPRSNEREMIYLSTDIIYTNHAKSYLAHEFTHLIEYNQKNRAHGVNEQTWLSEALAEYAPTHLGYNDTYNGSYLQMRVEDFIANPSISLTDWDGKDGDMAVSSLFAHYLAGHYGTGFLRDLMQSSLTGRQNITSALQKIQINETFADVYARWAVANYINTPTTNEKGSLYSYANPMLSITNLRVSPIAENSVFPQTQLGMNFGLAGGASQWVRFTPGSLGVTSKQDLNINFSPVERFGDFRVLYVTTNILGEARVGVFSPDGDGGQYVIIPDFGPDILSVTVVASNLYESDTSSTPRNGIYSLSVSITGESEGEVMGETQYPEGSLLRAVGDPKVYVIKAGTKRWISSPQIFNGYGHLRWDNIIEVEPSVLAQYTESRLIRFAGDPRVYQVNPTATVKQWLDMTPAQFESRGHSWTSIYEVNKNEFDSYTTGTAIK